MARSEAVAMAKVVGLSGPLLKEAGFKKRRHCFNRQQPDGLVHVVYFWMAPFEPPAWTEVPGLRERRYGGFRIDLGVWVPEMGRSGHPKSAWVNDYNCQLRVTIGHLLNPNSRQDFWWDLQDEGSASAARSALVDHGLGWLNRFPSKQAVVEAFAQQGSIRIGLSPAGALDIADLCNAIGRPAEARTTLEAYVDSGVLLSHVKYLSTYLAERGYRDLVQRIRTRD